MTVRTVLRMGDPLLRQQAEPVRTFNTLELHKLVQDLWETMAAEDGAGLAAPQIGVGLRVVVFGYEHNSRYPDAPPIPRTVLVNPIIEPLSQDLDEAWEGCLSVPGLRGLVPRYRHIRYRGYDPSGNSMEREVSDFHARVVQHECDHLDGVLYPQRIRDMSQFGFLEELTSAGAMSMNNLPCESEREDQRAQKAASGIS